MFRRRWSGLPADPVFVPDLKELGYFVNDIDEIRSIDNPDYYFKYYLTKNTRWNDRQRFAFNQAISKIILGRLTDNNNHNFTRLLLPLGIPPTSPHVPILTSPNLPTASRLILLFGESSQPLGVLAHRVIGGRGGVTKGSVLGLVGALKQLKSSATDPSPPGVLLANNGELWWWPEGEMGLTPTERHGVPMGSAVHYGRWHNEAVNEVEGNRSIAEHVKSVFETVVMNGELVNAQAKVDVIAVGDASDVVEGYLDDEEVWGRVGERVGSLAVLGGFYDAKGMKCEEFRRFMRERGRAYIIHHTPLDTPVAGPGGNPGASGFTNFGCPVYSAGEAQLTETMLIEAQPAILKWIQQVALEGDAYKNEEFEIFGEEGTGITTERPDSPWGAEIADAVDLETPDEKDADKKIKEMEKAADVKAKKSLEAIQKGAEEEIAKNVKETDAEVKTGVMLEVAAEKEIEKATEETEKAAEQKIEGKRPESKQAAKEDIEEKVKGIEAEAGAGAEARLMV
ncbi:hypothetical protein VTI74DRAFT_5901 [Chaetomium olivicolor]